MTLWPRLAALALSLVAVTAAPGANAQDHCAMYGRLALEQQRENLQRKCGFTGPEWSDDLPAHVRWCASVGPDQWKQQLKVRAEALAKRCAG